MTPKNRAPHHSWGDAALPLTLLGVIGLAAGLVLDAWTAATWSAQTGWPVPAVGSAMLDSLIHHGLIGLIGPAGSRPLFWILFVLLAVGAAVIVLLIVLGVRRLLHAGNATDSAGSHLARPADLTGITPRDVAASAARLRPGADLTDPSAHGAPLGVTLVGGVPLRMSWEDVAIGAAGPRTGKGTTMAIPWLLDAPGAEMATSNKPDLHDAVRGWRERFGHVWNFDPQHITDAGPQRGPEFWVNLLAQVSDVSSARRIAEYFVTATTPDMAKQDAYFDPEGRAVLVAYILAAALVGGDIVHAAEWLTDDRSQLPVAILTEKFPQLGRRVRDWQNLADKQRDGLYGTARKHLAVLDEPAYADWVTPASRLRFTLAGGQVQREHAPRHHNEVPEFDPNAFVISRDTLFLHSMEGPDSAAALTTALAGLVFEAGTAAARQGPGRRLATPLVSVLDEAANTCRLGELPNWYSHFGSRGMPVLTLVQSWSQGCEVWGERGMSKMWSAANHRWYAGGIAEPEFLRTLSLLIGDHDVERWSASAGRGGSTRSQSWTREPIMPPDMLAALPKGRAVLISSGNRPTMVRTVPWMTGPYADAVRESLSRFEPGDRRAARERDTARFVEEIAQAEANLEGANRGVF